MVGPFVPVGPVLSGPAQESPIVSTKTTRLDSHAGWRASASVCGQTRGVDADTGSAVGEGVLEERRLLTADTARVRRQSCVRWHPFLGLPVAGGKLRNAPRCP